MSTLIGGNPKTGSESLAGFTYPQFWELTQSMYKNNWRPQEIGSGDDMTCYRSKLTEAERTLFENQFSFLTFMDVNISRPLAWLLAIATAPEVSGWISRQIGEEANHSESYKYIADQTRLDEQELFSRHLQINAMQRKAELSRHYTDRIAAYAQGKYGIADLIDGVFFYSQCYEGIWFMGGFPPIFALCEQGKMINTGKQLEYIWRDENLHVRGWTEWLKLMQRDTGYSIPDRAAHSMIDAAVRAEVNYAAECLPAILHYSPEIHLRHIKRLANLRLRNLGFSPLYADSETGSPPWLGKYQSRKEVNFFESRVTEYQTGGALQWDE